MNFRINENVVLVSNDHFGDPMVSLLLLRQ